MQEITKEAEFYNKLMNQSHSEVCAELARIKSDRYINAYLDCRRRIGKLIQCDFEFSPKAKAQSELVYDCVEQFEKVAQHWDSVSSKVWSFNK